MPGTPIDPEREDKPTPVETGAFGSHENERAVPTRIEREPSTEQRTPEETRRRETAAAEQRSETPATATPVVSQPARAVNPVTKEVEEILSEDLGPLYSKMSAQEKVVFREEGERAATKIRVMLEQVRMKTRTLVDVIRKWLRLIPGINKFFLEQEAKIKTDKVVALHKQLHKQ